MGAYSKGKRDKKPLVKKNTRKYRKFHGNRYSSDHSTSFTSTSAQKLSTSTDFDVKCDDSFNYCILVFSLVFSALAGMLKCKTCNNDVEFTKTGIKGLGFKINILCLCGNRSINSCELVDKSFEINRRMVFVMQLLGVGVNGLHLFCSLMDLTSNFSKTTYYRVLENVKIASKSVADICLKKAGEEEKQKNKEHNLPEDELTISVDGTSVH